MNDKRLVCQKWYTLNDIFHSEKIKNFKITFLIFLLGMSLDDNHAPSGYQLLQARI